MSERRPALLSRQARERNSRPTRSKIVALGSGLALLVASFVGGVAPAAAAPSDLEIIPPTLGFGAIYAGNNVQVDVELKNTGADSVDISGLTFTSTDTDQLTVSAGTCDGQLAAQESCEFELDLHPNVVDEDFTATVTASMPGFSDTYTLSPTVLDPLTVSDTTLEFGDVLVGTEKELTRTFENVSGVPVTVTSAGGALNSPFTAIGNCQNKTLEPDEFCTYTYTFKPEDAEFASFDGTPSVLGVPYPLTLTGTGILPWDVSPAELNFGQVPVGSSGSLDLTVTNQSGADLTVPTHDLDLGEFFTTESFCDVGAELADGESCIMTVTFTPTEDKFVDPEEDLTFGTEEFAISAKGWGFTEPDYDMWEMGPLNLDFGEVPVGESKSLPTSLTFAGEGTGTLFPKNIELGGPFTVTPDPANPLCVPFAEIQVDESCDFIVTFTPTGAEDYTGTDTFSFWGSEFTLTAEGTGTVESAVVDKDDNDKGDDSDGTKDDSDLPETGADNVAGLIGLTALLVAGGAGALAHSRKRAHSAR